jgi:hypothetical protein
MVYGTWFEVSGLGCGLWGVGCGVRGVGCGVWGVGCRSCLAEDDASRGLCRELDAVEPLLLQGFGFRPSAFGFLLSGLGFGVEGRGLVRVQGFGFGG